MQQMHKRLFNRKLEKIFIFISYIYVFMLLYILYCIYGYFHIERVFIHTLIAPLPCHEAVFHREGFLSLQHFVF